MYPTFTAFPMQFLSTPSARRATSLSMYSVSGSVFLSTPSARRATAGLQGELGADADFYPRPPRGGRPMTASTARHSGKFLSTPSARRATATFAAAVQDLEKFLSTPSARRATS